MNGWLTHFARRQKSSAGSPSGRSGGLWRRARCPRSGCFGACLSRLTRCEHLWRVEPLRAIILRARSR